LCSQQQALRGDARNALQDKLEGQTLAEDGAPCRKARPANVWRGEKKAGLEPAKNHTLRG